VTASVPEASNQVGRPGKGKARFPRTARLLRHADFERVYKLGRRHFSPSMTVFYWQRQDAHLKEAHVDAKPPAKGLRIGFTVSRAHGGAVVRNRMKRRLREAVRLSRPTVGPNADVVINPKKSVLTLEFEAVLNEVRRAFVAIQHKLDAGVDKQAATGK
jgi:ribonuclease P protein component